jgi:hypothetical protein
VTDSSDRLTITNTTFQNNLGINGGAISIDNGYLLDALFLRIKQAAFPAKKELRTVRLEPIDRIAPPQ